MELVHHKRVAMNMGLRVFTIMGIVDVMATTALAQSTPLELNTTSD